MKTWSFHKGSFPNFSSNVKPLKVPNPQNCQTQSNNSSTVADELFQCVWPFCGVGTLNGYANSINLINFYSPWNNRKRGNRNFRLNSLIIRHEIWRWSLTKVWLVLSQSRLVNYYRDKSSSRELVTAMVSGD